MKTLIIYDNVGRILSILQGEPTPKEPVGVPFLYVDIPTDKKIKFTDGIGVDTSITPHELILEDVPKTEVELLKMQILEQQDALIELANLITGGTV